MTAQESPEICQVLEREVILPGVAPAAVAGIAVYRESWEVAVGTAGNVDGAPTQRDTPFDLASVTKPFFATTVARLVRAKVLGWGDALGTLLPDVVGSPSAQVPAELFLAHRSGLVGHRALFSPLVSRSAVSRSDAILKAATARDSACVGVPPVQGFPPVYSDLGYALLGLAAERLTGVELDALMRKEVLAPLSIAEQVGSARQWLGTRTTFLGSVAPTEHVGFRGGLIRGRVHDENAWALSGHGASGHAGLFGVIDGVLRFGMALLDALSLRDTTWLDAESLEPLLRIRPGGTLRAGFDGRAPGRSSAGERASTSTFGHLGFTGTSLWVDPEARAVTVFLSNRVHPSRLNLKIRAARPTVQDALYGHAGLNLSGGAGLEKA